MDFVFQGFQSSLPVWSYLLIFISTLLLAWWSYKDITGIRASYRYLLISLRSTVFFILLVLLVNPFIKTETPYSEDPTILVMLDNSASTSIQKSSYQGTKSYRQLISELEFQSYPSVNFNFFSVGSTTEATALDSLSFDAEQTNLSNVIQSIKANQADANAALLISDGIYTQGQTPVFESENVNIPIFTIGLGDTTSQKDILVQSVSTNNEGYLNTEQPVSVSVTSNGFAGESFQVQLHSRDQVLSTQTITPDLETTTQELTFDLRLEEEGLRQYEIVIPKLEEEWTGDNNTQRFSVDVKDSKQQILSLAFEVHPDVKYLRSLLLEDENTELTKRTWVNGNRFIEGPLDTHADSVDLIVVHGYPESGLSADIEKRLNNLAENVPMIIAATPLYAPQEFEREVFSLPVSVTGNLNYSPVRLSPHEPSASHPIMELPELQYDQLPHLSAPVKNIDTAPGATKLLNSIFEGQHTQKPILVVQEIGNRRTALLTSFGWFRFNQNTNPEVRIFGRELLLNIISWTATNPDNQLLEVEPAQTTFNGSENVVIDAYLTNERGQAESEATVGLSISGDDEESFYSMNNRGSGRYSIDLGPMPEGIYSFEATAEKGSRELDSRNGEFAVARSNTELINTVRNDQLLQQVADRSGGNYVPYDSISDFWNSLIERELLEQNEEFHTTLLYPYQHVGWFILVVLLLSAEWIFRKYLSLP